MGSIGRSIKRRQQKSKLKSARKEIKEKTSLTSLLPSKCLACEAPFDNTNQKMVDEWYMTVYRNPDKVNLYCPICWQDNSDNLDK